jgi:hypothetical protein
MKPASPEPRFQHGKRRMIMAKQGEPLDLRQALLDPAGSFAEPDDILRDARLSVEQKRQLLEHGNATRSISPLPKPRAWRAGRRTA